MKSFTVVLATLLITATVLVLDPRLAWRSGGGVDAATTLNVPWAKPIPAIEQLTHGKVHTADLITPKDFEAVRPYLSEGWARVIREGARIKIHGSTPATRLVPPSPIQATIQNAGKALVSSDGSLATRDAKPWFGAQVGQRVSSGADKRMAWGPGSLPS
jgi:hypothetical protein